MVVVLLGVFPVGAFAAEPAQTIQPVLNQVLYQTSAESWVSTQTAEVVISVSASLNEAELAKAHTQILANLNTIAKTNWHIIQFNRTPNESGLEQLQVQASARLPESELINARSQAKKLSHPGETYSVNSISFDPSLAEVQDVESALRETIYHQIQGELDKLNKLYPGQHYMVHKVDFTEQSSDPRMMSAMVNSGAAAPLKVQNKLILTANVILASGKSL